MIAGIHEMSAHDYHADPCVAPSLSASIAHTLLTSSPAHARNDHPRLNPDFARAEEQKFDVGTVSHALVLQGETIVEVVAADDWRTAAAKLARDTARLAGRVPLLTKDWAAVQAMHASALAQLELVDADPRPFTDGKPEQTLIWQEGDVWCRARVDWLRDDLAAIDDLKTTKGSANPEAWSRTLFTIGADVQVAFYLRGIKALTGMEPEWRFVVQETFPPYALSVVSLAPDVLALAEAKVEFAIESWRRCLEDDDWPAYPRRVCHVELPGWAESQWLAREAREAA